MYHDLAEVADPSTEWRTIQPQALGSGALYLWILQTLTGVGTPIASPVRTVEAVSIHHVPPLKHKCRTLLVVKLAVIRNDLGGLSSEVTDEDGATRAALNKPVSIIELYHVLSPTPQPELSIPTETLLRNANAYNTTPQVV
jgi:hypothetical protein